MYVWVVTGIVDHHLFSFIHIRVLIVIASGHADLLCIVADHRTEGSHGMALQGNAISFTHTRERQALRPCVRASVLHVLLASADHGKCRFPGLSPLVFRAEFEHV